MIARRMRSMATLAGMILATTLLARPADSGPWKPILDDAAFKTLVTAETKVLNETLAKGLGEKKMMVKAHNSAMMLAAYAQSAMLAGKDATKMAGERNNALKIAKAAGDGKADQAKSLAAKTGNAGKGQ